MITEEQLENLKQEITNLHIQCRKDSTEKDKEISELKRKVNYLMQFGPLEKVNY